MNLKFVLAGLLFAAPAFAQPTDGTDPNAGDGTGAGVEVTGEAGAGATVGTGGDGTVMAVPAVAVGSLNPARAGKITIMGSTVNINMSAESVAKPISFAPSVYYGIDDKLSIGLTHDGGTTPMTPRPALGFTTIVNPFDPTMSITVPSFGGICISGEDSGCIDPYSNVGVDGIYALSDGKLSIAAHGGLDAFILDPLVLQLRAGVIGRYLLAEKMSLVFDPRLRIGLTERDFNKEAIDIPAWFWFTASPQIAAYLHTGIAGPLDGFGDGFYVPVQVGANYEVNQQLTAGLDFSFVNLLGNGGDADGRVLSLRAVYRL